MVGTFRQHRTMLIAANVILGLVILCSLIGFLVPPKIKEPAASGFVGSSNQMEETESQNKPLTHYNIIYTRNLRKPLYDPKPVKVVKAPPPKPQLTVDLLGTVLEDGFTYAILKNRSGKTSFVSLGESLDGVEVTKIEKDSATVSFCGDSIVLKVKDKGDK